MPSKTKTKSPKPATKKRIGTDILVAVVLDRSGSMQSVCDSTIAGYNAYLAELAGKGETKYSITATLFDAPMRSIELSTLCVNAPLAQAIRLSRENYEPRGWTPLYDAIGLTIRATESAAAGRPVVMMIVTDGQENASHEFTSDSIKKLIAEKEKDGWTFVFMGANIDSYHVGTTLGVSAKNIANYAPGFEQVAFTMACSGTKSYASNRIATRSLRQASDEGFFDHLAKDDKGQVTIGAPDPAGVPSQWINNQPLTSTGGAPVPDLAPRNPVHNFAPLYMHIPFVTGTTVTPRPTTKGSREHRPLK